MNLDETRKRILEDDEFVLGEIDKIRYIYRLKKEIRYAQRRNDILDTESVAEHIFGMHVLTDYFLPLEDEFNQLDRVKVSQMVTWHELDEIETGDVVTHLKTDKDIEEAQKSLPIVLEKIPKHISAFAKDLYDSYEKRESKEAKFVKAIDKAEPIFEIWGDGYKKILHLNKTKYDNHWLLKAPYLKDFPLIERFSQVATERLLKNGYFVSDE